MTGASSVAHQIEYRWVPVRDMSPVASSMSPGLTAGWDPLIRPWVRHPAAATLSESVCYKVLAPEVAALAWRYRDQLAAEREDGTQGRPLVSRVLIGSPGQLTPDLAVRLCRAGLPDLAGPPPGRLDHGEGLQRIDTVDLAGLAVEQADELDKVAGQEKGLQQVVAAALSDPDTPLGIQIRDPFIFFPLRTAPQSLLLWGMWRTVEPLLGADGRGWSFSTFELPMGSQDLSTLPAIVFRQTQSASGPPASSRPELRVRPGDLSAPATPLDTDVVELARWLVEEYRQAGGDGLRELVAGCGAGQPLEARRGILLKKLRNKYSPLRAGPAASLEPVRPAPGAVPGPADAGESAVPGSSPAAGDQEYARRHRGPQQRSKRDYWEDDQVQDVSSRWQETQSSAVVGRRDPAREPDASEEAEGAAPPDAFDDQGSRQAAASGPGLPASGGPWPGTAEPRPLAVPGSERQDVLRDSHGDPHRIEFLVRRLEDEQDDQKFQRILDNLLSAPSKFDERVAVRRLMPKNNWSITALQRHGYQDYLPVLTGIFFVLVLPDLESSTLAPQLSEWVRHGPPQVTAALLMAAKDADNQERHSGGKKFQLMTAALGDAALQKLLEISDIAFDWPSPPKRGARSGNHSRPGFFTKILIFFGLVEDPPHRLT